MQITREHSDGKILLLLDGDLDERTSSVLEKELENSLGTGGEDKIELDMGRVRYISSIGIRTLIIAHKKALKSGKHISIGKLSEKAREMLDIVGILPLFGGREEG